MTRRPVKNGSRIRSALNSWRAGLAAFLLFLVWLPALEAREAPRAITLKDANGAPPPPPPAGEPQKIKPSFKENAFPLRKAKNRKAVFEIIGPLDDRQKRFLEKNRFLILPKPKYLTFRPSEKVVHDEMLANFDGLGGSLAEHQRRPHNARFIGPDVFLHAFDRYLARRRQAAEAGPLREEMEYLLSGLYANARDLKAETGGTAARNWERLMTQLAVPLVLVKNGAADSPDDLGGARKIFEAYRPDFSRAAAGLVTGELERVYRARGTAPGALGLTPADGGAAIDYRWFQPPVFYADSAPARAYHRAATWLGRLGWAVKSEEGLADALNFALAMSSPRPANQAEKAPRAVGDGQAEAPANGSSDLGRAWARIADLQTLFSGYPVQPGYRQWLPFIMKEAGVPEFTAATAADGAVLARLSAAVGSLGRPWLHYLTLRSGEDRPVVCPLPEGRSLARLAVERLTYRTGINERAPVMFSGLWLPALLGQPYARAQAPRQLALASGGDPRVLEDEHLRELVRLASQDLLKLSDDLRGELAAKPEACYLMSVSGLGLKLSWPLTAVFGSGHPLYMQSEAYPAKQAETVLGFWTELESEPVLSARPVNPAADPESSLGDEEPAPLVKGFVEPNVAFWAEMIRAVDHLASRFAYYGLFPEDLEDMGALSRFRKRLERCLALSEKELRSSPLTGDDYEFIRLFSLDWMAAPVGGADLAPPVRQTRASALSPAQTFGLEGDGRPMTVYEANGEPNLILVLVGNEKSPRLTVGLVYNHYEFVEPLDRPLTEDDWRARVYQRHARDPDPAVPALPEKNVWYDGLKVY